MALAYAALGRNDEAISTLQTLLEKTARPDGKYTGNDASNRTVFLEHLGTLYRETGKTQHALDTFRQMLDMSDDSAIHGYEQIIDTYREQKQWAQATTAVQEATERFPKNTGLRLVLAGQLVDNGKVQEGIGEAKKLLKGNKEDREIYIAISQIYSRMRQWKEAEEVAASAERLSDTPEALEYVHFVQGSIFERQKKFDLAEEHFRNVLANNPKNAGALNYLGYMYADRGIRLDEALTLIKKALEIEPQNGAYLDSLGWAYFKQGNYELAEENLHKAISKISNDATLHEHLGDLYQKTGRLKLATAHWERALEEWNKSVATEVDQADVASVQKKLESAKVKLARQEKQ